MCIGGGSTGVFLYGPKFSQLFFEILTESYVAHPPLPRGLAHLCGESWIRPCKCESLVSSEDVVAYIILFCNLVNGFTLVCYYTVMLNWTLQKRYEI